MKRDGRLLAGGFTVTPGRLIPNFVLFRFQVQKTFKCVFYQSNWCPLCSPDLLNFLQLVTQLWALFRRQ